MRKTSPAILAATLAAAFAAGSAFGQTDSRVYDVMRRAESGTRAVESTAVATTDLVRIRAAGESRPGEGAGREYQAVTVEKPAADIRPQTNGQDTAKSQEDPRSVARARAAEEKARTTEEKARAQGAVFYLRDSRDSNGEPRAYITETQRAAEHARYEANKRRGVSDPATAATAQARPAAQAADSGEAIHASSTTTRAAINWSETQRPAQTSVYQPPMANGNEQLGDRNLIATGDVVRARAILSNLR